TLRMLDGDYVDPATSPRWQLGFAYAGQAKVRALHEFIHANHPYTRVEAVYLVLGDTGNGNTESEALAAMFNGADLIYDATAERGLQHLLSDLAREEGLPYVFLQATKGGWGGLVARINPTGACWSCLQWALSDGTI